MKTQTKKRISWGILAPLALSLAGNVWLLSGFWSPPAKVAAAVPAQVPRVGTPSTLPTAERANALTVPAVTLSFADSPERLAEVLARTSIPRVVWEEIVRGRINQVAEERKLDLVRKLAATTPWWAQRTARRNPVSALSPNDQNELAETEIAARSEVLAVLGPEVFDRYGLVAARYDFVSPEKALRLDFLVRDYDNLTRVTRASMRSVVTAEDRRVLQLLQDERDKELRELLTEAELRAFRARVAPPGPVAPKANPKGK